MIDFDPREHPARFSHVKLFAQSAAHYRQRLRVGDETSSDPIGSAVHSLVLGVGAPVVLYPARRAGKEWDSFEAANVGALVLNEREWTLATAMQRAVIGNDEAANLLHVGTTIEQRIDWEYLGRKCRSTPDAFRTIDPLSGRRADAHHVTELKTCQTAQPFRFVRDGLRYSYHVQLAVYRLAIEHATGVPRNGLAHIVAVEKTPPHVVQCFRLTDQAIEQGERIWRRWFEQLLACEATNEWPGYSESIVDFDLPDPNGGEAFSLLVGGQEIEVQ